MARARTPPPPAELTPIGFEVLLSLAAGPRHGYGIKLDIEERTQGELSLGSGTLYQAIQRLEREGLIGEASDSDDKADARRGRTYRLEPRGRAIRKPRAAAPGSAADRRGWRVASAGIPGSTEPR